MSKQERRIATGASAGIVICVLIWLVAPLGPVRQLSVFLLAWIWPAVTWSIWWNGVPSERIVIGAGMSLMLNALLALGITYSSGPTPAWVLLLGVLVTAVSPLILLRLRAKSFDSSAHTPGREAFLLVGLLLLAILLRVPGMGYKELQGDEGIIMVRAATILNGDDAEWFNHQKGPMEIVVPLVGWGLGESINDYWARLPFTWAGILAVLGIYSLGRKWFGERAGLSSGLLIAVGGFGIAFSRIIQYQSLVMLWGVLALLMATRFRTDGRRADLLMACLFVAAGILAHYDALLVAPAVAWLLAGRIRYDGQLRLKPWLLALAIAGIVLLLFYLPFVLSPNFSGTFNYLVSERVGVSGESAQLAAGLVDSWRMMTFYNSLWYIVGLASVTVVALIVLAKRRTDFAAVLYFAIPALFYLLVVRDPRTHVYAIFPGATILAGLGVTVALRAVQSHLGRPAQVVAAAISALWFIVVLIYPLLLFVDTSLERQRTWPENRPLPALYPTTWDDPPRYGLFGFPHQAGWRAAGQLLTNDGLFHSIWPYGSNEEAEITNWYMAQAPRTHCDDANTFLVVTNAQDEVRYNSDWLSREMSANGEIAVNGKPSMLIYGQEMAGQKLEEEATDYDLWLTPAETRRSQRMGETAVGVNLGRQIRLLGYDLDIDEAFPGGQITLTLYWQALDPIDRNYQVFVHLYDGSLWAQHDGAPECDANPTTRWEPGQIIADPHVIDLPAALPEGPMPIVVGMYDLLTEERLPVEGNEDDTVPLTEIVIREN